MPTPRRYKPRDELCSGLISQLARHLHVLSGPQLALVLKSLAAHARLVQACLHAMGCTHAGHSLMHGRCTAWHPCLIQAPACFASIPIHLHVGCARSWRPPDQFLYNYVAQAQPKLAALSPAQAAAVLWAFARYVCFWG